MSEHRKYAVEMPTRYAISIDARPISKTRCDVSYTSSESEEGHCCNAEDVKTAFDGMQDEIDRLKASADKRMEYIADVTVVLDTKVGETAIKAAKRLMSQLAAEREKAAKAREEALREAAAIDPWVEHLNGNPIARVLKGPGHCVKVMSKLILALIDKEGAK